jgi:uncharacterized protein (TIGR00369 family)
MGTPCGSGPVNVDGAREALAAQPFSTLLGARLLTFSASGVTLALAARADLRQQDGIVHGGVISYLADNAIAFAAGAVLGAGVLTSSLTVDYLRPARGDLTAHAWVVHVGRSRALTRCEVTTVSTPGEAVVCALAQGSAVRRPHPDETVRPTTAPAETS